MHILYHAGCSVPHSMVSRVRDALISACDTSDIDRCLQALQALSGSLSEVFPGSSVADKDVMIQMFV